MDMSQGAPIALEPVNLESTPRRRQPRYYAVAVGHTTGIFTSYDAAAPHIAGHPYGRLKKFKTSEEAEAYVEKYKHRQSKLNPPEKTMPTADRVNLPGYQEYRQQHAAEPPGKLWNHIDCGVSPELQQYYDSELQQQGNESFSSRTLQSAPKPDLQVVSTDQISVPADTGPALVHEQQHVVDLILAGRNVFYTGSAGCGKSTILKAAVRQLQQRGKRVKIVAPTNLAALNVGGITTWSYAGWTVQSMKRDIDKLMRSALGDKSWQRFDETDVLIIDEISMIENLFFERLNMVIKASRGEKYGGGPFGGMQLIVTGDVSPTKHADLFMIDEDSSTNCHL
jgi:ATP-dependent DNA helicase PIF1